MTRATSCERAASGHSSPQRVGRRRRASAVAATKVLIELGRRWSDDDEQQLAVARPHCVRDGLRAARRRIGRDDDPRRPMQSDRS